MGDTHEIDRVVRHAAPAGIVKTEAIAGSFRDPAGFVYETDGGLRRQVNEPYRADYEHLMSSGLYQALVDEGLLVRHEEVDEPGAAPRAFKVLAPERVPFISYPYEWCFGELKDAALATLRIQSLALDHGMSLRDASAYNIQFLDGSPTLIDTLSFERLREGTPWVAYRQFCQHFLAPLALMSMVDVRLSSLLRVHIDGIPLDLASALLPSRSRLRPAIFLHIHSHARSQERHADKPAHRDDVKGRFSLRAFRGLVDSLGSAVRALDWTPASGWARYYNEADHYSEEGHDLKQQLVGEYVTELRPGTVWDLGANTGLYSRIAVDAGAFTLSFDLDAACVEAHYRQIRGKNARVLPLVLDLTNPSPGIGWHNSERLSLRERGKADVLLALALIHHLAIGNNVPLDDIADAFHDLGENLVIEFVPKSDPKVRLLLASRDDIFPNYTREGFEEAFERRFSIDRRDDVRGSERTMYLMRAR